MFGRLRVVAGGRAAQYFLVQQGGTDEPGAPEYRHAGEWVLRQKPRTKEAAWVRAWVRASARVPHTSPQRWLEPSGVVSSVANVSMWRAEVESRFNARFCGFVIKMRWMRRCFRLLTHLTHLLWCC